MYFNPRSSCEERPSSNICILLASKFQSTLLMRGATSWAHAPLWCSPISIHAPHARSDMGVLPGNIIETFQSTLLMRGATALDAGLLPSTTFQSTLLMRGATWAFYPATSSRHFNPRSSCEERPPVFMDSSPIDADFNPRSSCEERQGCDGVRWLDAAISIHAPHARSDSAQSNERR